MPELPEVESVKLQLVKFLVGHKVESVEVNLPKVVHGDIQMITGTKIISVRRFAKVIVIDFDNNIELFEKRNLLNVKIY